MDKPCSVFEELILSEGPNSIRWKMPWLLLDRSSVAGWGFRVVWFDGENAVSFTYVKSRKTMLVGWSD